MTVSTPNASGPALLDPSQEPPLDRYCDVVMKGGVTDGVVYPWAVMDLAQHYRFQSIGGTSVGAVAAALTAASEYSRRYGSVNGFNKVLREVPLGLAELQSSGQTKLFSLFHPSPGGERLFRLFVGFFSKQKGLAGTWAIIKELLADYLLSPNLRLPRDRGILLLLIGGALLLGALCLLYPATVLPLLLVLLSNVAAIAVLLLGIIGWRLLDDVRRQLGGPGCGLCTGMGPKGGPDGFTDWLHKGIQGASARDLDKPLTFRDLWDAPGGPDLDLYRDGWIERPQSIALQMMSTNLTHGRACGLPLNDNSERLYFLEADLAPYFPDEVMTHLCACSPVLDDYQHMGLRRLPQGDLPVLVAARLSLSFPILFKAVPLWAVPAIGAPYRCWFSDGGICANFPIHLFDAVLPRWPTFGITLVDRKHASAKVGDIWVDEANTAPPELSQPASKLRPAPPSLGRLFTFLGSILNAARLWNDNATARLPGVRERIVKIYLDPEGSQGGLNLTMPPQDLLALASLGQQAGQALVDRYITAAPGNQTGCQPPNAWEVHRWVRFNTFVRAIQDKMHGFTQSARRAPHTQPLGGLTNSLDQSLSPKPIASPYVLTTRQAQALRNVELALAQLEANLDTAAVTQPFEPSPQPELRLRATL
jgi:predicted acylesterase/phospholipase RssA